MFRAVIFDFFGTLTRAVARGPAHERIARRLGCAPEAFAAELNATFVARSVGALGDPAMALAHVAARLGVHPSARRLRGVLADRVAAVAADTALRPGVVHVLGQLRRMGMSIALLSDCGPELPEFLSNLSVAPLLDATVLSIETGLHKPDPQMYFEACRRLDVAPAQCLYVGDGGSHELTGAVAVGMTAVRLAAPDLGDHLVFGRDTEFTGPSIESLYEVPALAQSLRTRSSRRVAARVAARLQAA